MNTNKVEQIKIQYQGAPLGRSVSQYELSFSEFEVKQIVIFSNPKSIDIKKYIPHNFYEVLNNSSVFPPEFSQITK